MRYRWIDSPVGRILIAGDAAGLRRVGFAGEPVAHQAGWLPDDADPVLGAAAEQLGAYFCGRLRQFDLPLAPAGTEFQRLVWEAVRAIPYGTTSSYGAIAASIGRPGASRAVGAANAANPVPIVVPCHRVVGTDGSLTGYGAGLTIKRALIELERAHSSGGRWIPRALSFL
jgi:methylated-DNA-[protein]-cysteine S-methyltransferase